MLGEMWTQSPEPIARSWLYSDDLMSLLRREAACHMRREILRQSLRSQTRLRLTLIDRSIAPSEFHARLAHQQDHTAFLSSEGHLSRDKNSDARSRRPAYYINNPVGNIKSIADVNRLEPFELCLRVARFSIVFGERTWLPRDCRREYPLNPCSCDIAQRSLREERFDFDIRLSARNR